MREQCACARDYEWLPEHYTLAHHPRCGGQGVGTIDLSPQTATGAMIAMANARSVAPVDRRRVTAADVEFWERRHGDTVHVTAVLRLATDGAYSVRERESRGSGVQSALRRELAHRLLRAVYGDVWRLASEIRGEMRDALLSGGFSISGGVRPSSELLDMGLAEPSDSR